jgi:hypothetical protein
MLGQPWDTRFHLENSVQIIRKFLIVSAAVTARIG